MAVREQLPERYQLVVWLGAGLGFRQGEIFGLSLADIDLERGEIHVRRQVKLLAVEQADLRAPEGPQGPGGSASRRGPRSDQPHMTSCRRSSVTLPWDTRTGSPAPSLC